MSPPWLGGTRRRAQQSAERERGWTVGALSHGAVSPQLLGLMQALALAAPPPAPRGAGEEGGGMGILLRDFFFNGTGSELFSPIDKGIASEYLTTFSTVVVFASLLSFVVGRSTFVVDCFFGILNSKVVVGSLRIL